MRVRRGDDGDFRLDRQAYLGAREVEAVWKAVRLQGDPGLQRDLEDGLEVEGVRRPVVDDPALRMAEARDRRVAHRLRHLAGERLTRLALAGVEAELHPVELGEDVGGEVEPALAQDVHLGPAQDAKRRQLLVGRGDLLALAAQVVCVEPRDDADDLRRQGEVIAAANERLAPFRILRGSEVDIRADGELDLPDDVLAELDWVQLSLHAGQRERRDALTSKVTNAMRHPAVNCLSHPKGRILNHRPPNALDLERVIEVALETGVALEVNGLPDRLDLAGSDARLAVEAGVPLVASTDAHSVRGLGNMQLAIATARRGWATRADVLNTRSLDEILWRRRG